MRLPLSKPRSYHAENLRHQLAAAAAGRIYLPVVFTAREISFRRATNLFTMLLNRRIFAVVLLLIPSVLVPAQTAPRGVDTVRARYTKFEYRVPMRDGVRLFTSIYVPKESSRRYPFLIARTPYSVAPYGIDNYRSSLGPSASFDNEGSFLFTRTLAAATCPKVNSYRFVPTLLTSVAPGILTKAPIPTTRLSGY
ncbi:MAG: hypothetical protein ACR2LM_03730 [Pyrinomonadaceae bacterium]